MENKKKLTPEQLEAIAKAKKAKDKAVKQAKIVNK